MCGSKKGQLYVNTDYHIIEYDLKQEKSKIIFKQGNTQTLPSLTFHYGLNRLWIGMKDSIFSYDGRKSVLKYVLNKNNSTISAMKESSSGKLYAGTKNGGVFCFEKSGAKRRVLPLKTEVISINEDSKHNIWIATFNEGLFCISMDGKIKQYQAPLLSSNYVRAVCEDDNGDIWIGTMLGLDILNTKTGSISHQGLAEKGKPGLSNLSVWIITKDDQGTMWIGTYYGGLDYYNYRKNIFKYYDLGFEQREGPIVSKIVEDKSGILWIGTEGRGLISYNPLRDTYRYYTKEQKTIPHNNIKSLYYDQQDHIVWIGTHLGGLSAYSSETREFTNYTIDPLDNTKRSEIVQAIVRYKNLLFIGTLSGMYYMDLNTGNIHKIKILDKYIYAVNSLMIDKNKTLWIGGNTLCNYNIKQNYVRSFDRRIFQLTSSSKNTITALFAKENGNIIIGTAGSGILIYNPETEYFSQISRKNSNISSDYISAIRSLQNNYLLVSGANGLSCIDIKDKSCYNYDLQNGFVLSSMIPGDIIKDSHQQIVMGGLNGMATVKENSLFSKKLPVKIYFSKLWVNNKEVATDSSSGILSQTLQNTTQLKLKHDENNIAIETGNNNFVNLGQPQYQYTLEGYDEQWIDFRPQGTIRYMNLPYGDYVLKVRNKLFGEQSKSEEIRMGISVIPPVYATWYAYLFYIIAGLSVAGSIFYFYYSRLALRSSLELERRDQQQKDAINESKMRFLGNISHELKTPVTLISGQLELILMSKNTTPAIKNNLKEVHNRASKMSQLINELLDFLKYNKEIFKLKVSQQSIVQFTQEIYDSFTSYANLRKINFDFKYEGEHIFLWFDHIQLQKVFNNILSNAFKFTPEGGQIEIAINTTETAVEILFQDSGIGIPEEMTEKIFDRFFQVNNPINADLSNTGAGIGLSLALNIVKSHYGKIKLSSEEGKGSLFIVELPLGNHHFKNDANVEVIENEKQYEPVVIEILDEDKEFIDDLIEEQKEILQQQASILIVEDDEEIRKLLIKIFEPLFNVYEANNGEDAFKIAQNSSPDLILSDVMMSGISGINLCARIKNNFDTSHIPVVLLTALSSRDQNIIGYNSGADDYITKPFDIRLLITRCVALLNNRIKLQEKYRKQGNNNTAQVALNPLDQEFIDKSIKIIEDNIVSGNIDVELLCSELAISRTKLFLKMKGITGQTPHDFIQNIKLNTAAKMLRENQEHNISDIAYHLGFSSLNYFGKSFKDYFGVSPSAYRKSFLDKLDKGEQD